MKAYRIDNKQFMRPNCLLFCIDSNSFLNEETCKCECLDGYTKTDFKCILNETDKKMDELSSINKQPISRLFKFF
ncbi:unnamed protein product [Brachionus calyciflorus]|uniref:Uncharacterized protein n=1 Tax=Brachionus calyciflorus TaxID=104777 RepID=A0A814RFU1_9BILA|nr:unnamed protein product [Brachionus calyciflorus]